MKIKIIYLLLILLSILLISKNSQATYKIKYMEMLPDYCQYVYPNWHHPNAIKYKNYFGDIGWGGWHHYCFGLDKLNIAIFKSKNLNRQKFYLRSAVQEFDFLLQWLERNGNRNYRFRPQVLLKKGQTLKMMGEYHEAIISYKEAIRSRKNFVPAYIALNQVFLILGDKKSALKALKTGLKYAPESRELKQKIKELSTKP